MSSYGSITSKDVHISHDEYLSGKYRNITSRSGEHYARVWYIGNDIDAGKTYSDSYCKKHGLGKYAGGGSSSSSSSRSSSRSSSGGGLGSLRGKTIAGAIGGAIVSGVKNSYEKDKQRQEEDKARNEQIDSKVDPLIEALKSSLERNYPIKTDDPEILLGYILALHKVVLSHKEITPGSSSDIDIEAEHRYESQRLEMEGNHLYKLIKRLKKKSELRKIEKDANKYSGRRGRKIALLVLLIFAVVVLCVLNTTSPV